MENTNGGKSLFYDYFTIRNVRDYIRLPNKIHQFNKMVIERRKYGGSDDGSFLFSQIAWSSTMFENESMFTDCLKDGVTYAPPIRGICSSEFLARATSEDRPDLTA